MFFLGGSAEKVGGIVGLLEVSVSLINNEIYSVIIVICNIPNFWYYSDVWQCWQIHSYELKQKFTNKHIVCCCNDKKIISTKKKHKNKNFSHTNKTFKLWIKPGQKFASFIVERPNSISLVSTHNYLVTLFFKISNC